MDPHKYGLPDQKKYPMPDAAHVRSAIKFFNYVDPAHEKELAKAILKRMKEYEMSFDDFTVGENNRFSKYVPDNVLEHHGILGQKWGVRRYQNADGSLTDAGKKRYSVKTETNESVEDYYGLKVRERTTKHTISTKNGTSETKKHIDKMAYEEDYDTADELDYRATKVLKEYEDKGEEAAIKLLETEFKDYEYSMVLEETEYLDYGAKAVTYTLSVIGDNTIFITSGDRDSSDDQYFIRKPKSK